MCLCNALYVWEGRNPGTFKFFGREVALNREGMGGDRRFQKKKNAEEGVFYSWETIKLINISKNNHTNSP